MIKRYEVFVAQLERQLDAVGPIWSQLQEQKQKQQCDSWQTAHQRFRHDGEPAVFKFKTKVTEDIFIKSAKLLQSQCQWSYLKNSL